MSDFPYTDRLISTLIGADLHDEENIEKIFDETLEMLHEISQVNDQYKLTVNFQSIRSFYKQVKKEGKNDKSIKRDKITF